MRYIRSSGSFKQHKPQKNGWFGFLSSKKRKVSISSAVSLPPLRGNPYKKIKRESRGALPILKKLAVPAIFLAWLTMMVYIPYFKVNQVTYIGLSTIKKDDIDTKLREKFLTTKLFIPRNNYFLLRSGSIKNFLQEQYSFESIEVKKNFPHTLVIDVVEKATSIIVDTGVGYYMVDQTGNTIRQILTETQASTSMFTTLVVENASTSTTSTSSTTSVMTDHKPDYITVQKEYANIPLTYIKETSATSTTSTPTIAPALVQSILNTHSAITKNKIARIKYIEVNKDEQTLTVYSDRPWKILMRTVGDIQTQTDNLKVVIRDNKPTEYVDVRFGERVYWK